MGSFPRILLSVCLNLMKWLFWGTAVLMLVLLVVQQLRGDEGAVPVQLAIGAGAMGLLGLACVWGSRFFANAR